MKRLKQLEEKVTRGLVIYIHGMDIDLDEKRITIRFLQDPEGNAIARILTFTGVQDFSEELLWDEGEDEDCIDSLIGLDEYPEGSEVRYVVHTESREMIFRTNEAPLIEEV